MRNLFTDPAMMAPAYLASFGVTGDNEGTIDIVSSNDTTTKAILGKLS